MITIDRIGGQNVFSSTELKGLSTDTKPTTDINNGSTFYEMDTKKVFMYDEENLRWLEQ